MIIITRKEAKVKGLIKYFTGKPCKHGHVVERKTSGGQCTECDKLERKRNGKKRGERYRVNNKQKNREYQREWYHNNKESAQASCKKYKENNKEKVALQQKISIAKWKEKNPDYYSNWWKNNKEKARAYRQNSPTRALIQKQWRENNRGYCNYHTRKRQRRIIISTPAWANQDKIKNLYVESAKLKKDTGVEYHVDHIIPLHGQFVCGLHVETNLRIITAAENLRKGNKY